MELTFEKDDLLKTVQVLQGVASSRNTLPILSNLLVQAQDDHIEMCATDLEVSIRIVVPGVVVEPGSITVPARKISEITRELPSSSIKLVTTANDRVEIECERGMYTMVGLAGDEFPPIMSMSESFFTIDAQTFIEMIVKTSFAASTEEVRYHLNGVYLHLTPDSTKVVATDGRRLAVANTAPVVWSEASEETDREERGVIVPLRAVGEIRKTFAESETLKIGFSENQIIFSDDTSMLTSRLVEGEFPEYDKIIPADNDISITIDTQQLLSVVRRVSLLANPKTLLVKFEAQDGILKLSANTPDFGEAREEMEIKRGDGNIQIAFSAKLILDVLTHVDMEDVALNLKDPLSAALLQPAIDDDQSTSVDYRYLIMPMRLE